jgi:hypothetical protein
MTTPAMTTFLALASSSLLWDTPRIALPSGELIHFIFFGGCFYTQRKIVRGGVHVHVCRRRLQPHGWFISITLLGHTPYLSIPEVGPPNKTGVLGHRRRPFLSTNSHPLRVTQKPIALSTELDMKRFISYRSSTL